MKLAPCPFRHVDDEGHILCEKIKTGDREVSPNVCRACPVMHINCAHLRATLNHDARPPITVRYGNGKTEIWEDDAPSISLERAACAAKVIPILSPRDCAGCPLRQALVMPDAIVGPNHIPASTPAGKTAPQPRFTAPPLPTVATTPEQQTVPMVVQPQASIADQVNSEEEKKRSSLVARKIIQLQEWLEKQKTAVPPPAGDALPPARAVGVRRPPPPSRPEEKRVGWTD